MTKLGREIQAGDRLALEDGRATRVTKIESSIVDGCRLVVFTEGEAFVPNDARVEVAP